MRTRAATLPSCGRPQVCRERTISMTLSAVRAGTHIAKLVVMDPRNGAILAAGMGMIRATRRPAVEIVRDL